MVAIVVVGLPQIDLALPDLLPMRTYLDALKTLAADLPPLHRRGMLAAAFVVLAALLWPVTRLPVGEVIELELDAGRLSSDAPVILDDPSPSPDFPNWQYQIRSGDTLSAIFSRLQLDSATMQQLLESDVDVLALDTLKPGNQLRFWVNAEAHRLDKLELYFNPAHQVVFERVDGDYFTFEEINHPGEWRERPARTEIHGPFFNAAIKAGLDAGDVAQIESLFKGRLNFRRDLKAGDLLQLVRKEQFIGAEASGNTELLAVEIIQEKRRFSAFLAEDGNYYDADGGSQTQAFLRFPLAQPMRVSSHFNPQRRHPVTGRIKPHNGTDFPLPTGTPVLATGDGVVTKVANHQYAGLYLVLQFSGKYKARYLHLSKALVREGQRVSRGDRIALSGNTGRSTGPHLHYEFHVAGKPVNPMSAALPMTRLLSDRELRNFKRQVAEWRRAMQQAG